MEKMNKEGFLKRGLFFAHERNLWHAGDRILAAVSGGPDSLGLLLFLKEVAERENISVGCCTVHHHLREAAEEETEYVRQVCRDLGIPFYRKDVEVEKVRKREGGSLETVARNLRYEALHEVMEEGKYNLLATAHHANDQAETILFHFLRGSGIKGLAGILPKRGKIIRPFLWATKEEIRKFIFYYPYHSFHDATNDIPDTSRNKIRLLLMPELLSFNPNLVESLSRLAEGMEMEDDFLEEERKKEDDFFLEGKGSILYPRSHFRSLHPAMQHHILMEAVMRVNGKSPDFLTVKRMRKLAEGKAGKRTSGAGVVMETSEKYLSFFSGSTRKKTEKDKWDDFRPLYEEWMEKASHESPETGIIKNISLSSMETEPWILTEEIWDRPVKTGKDQYLLDGDKVGTLHLRKARKEDRLEPNGMEGSKSVFSILQEHRIPGALRREWPVVADENHVYWVGFLRGSRFARVTSQTRKYLRLTLRWKNKEIEK